MTNEKKRSQPHISPEPKKDRSANKKLLLEIGERLRKIRLKKNWTQDQMAEKLGIAKTFYGKIERGESRISLEKLVLLWDDMEVDLNYLLTGHEKVVFKIETQQYSEKARHHMISIIKNFEDLIKELSK